MTRKLFTLAALVLILGLFADGLVQTAYAEKEGRKNLRDKFEKTVTNISNGVVIEITSTDTEAVEKIQERMGKFSERKGKNRKVDREKCDEALKIDRKVENISNGIRITITSDDPEAVKKIQERAEENLAKRGKDTGRGSGQMRGTQDR